MSSKVDDRIVNMKFNNAQFEKGVSETSKSLEDLKKGLTFKDVGKGLGDLATGVKNLSLDGLASGVESVANKFSALSIVGITALANIANKAIDAGMTIAKSLTIDPIKAGFAEYEMKMGSIQTILANTQKYGTTLPQVTAELDKLNEYADQTIYNFGDMTKNIGLFTNAGIRVEDATSMIKGYSNAAAASGTSASGAAQSATQLAQALSAGVIRAQDWVSLTTVGMGNKNMQDSLYQIAVAAGEVTEGTEEAIAIQSNFKGSLESNWLSADTMSKYLQIMAGDMDAASMSAMGLTDAQISMFQEQQRTAQDAAQKVRTWTQLIGTMQESVGSGWSETFDILIGDFEQATALWTGVNKKLGPIIEGMSKARNEFVKAFVDSGGRDAVIGTLSNAFSTLMDIGRVIGRAWTDIFPPATGEQIANMAKAVQTFVENLRPSPAAFRDIQSAAKGFFALLDIGWMVLKGIIGLFGDLVGAISPAGGGILEMSGNLGDWLVNVRDAIKNGEGLTKIFDWLREKGEKLAEVFGNVSKWLGDTLAVDSWGEAWQKLTDAVKAGWDYLQPFFQWVGEAFEVVKDAVAGFFKTMDFNVLVGLLNVGALTGVGLLIKGFFDKILGLFKGGPGGIIDTIKGVFTAITDTFGAMQQKLKSEALQKIAMAIALLTASVIALSFVDTGKLFTALGAMTIMFGQLSGMLIVMDKAMGTFSVRKMTGLAGAMVLLAGAMLFLSASIAILGNLEWDELARGLIGMAGGLGALVGASLLLDKVKLKMGPAAGAIFIMAVAMVVLAAALKIFSTMSWDDILRSMTVLSASMAVMLAASQLAQKAVGGATAMILMGVSLAIMAGSLKVFSTMSWDDILRSMTVMAATIGILVGATAILSTLKMAPVGAASMIVMAIAITILAGAMKIFATMSWEEIGKSLVMLAGSLAILAGAMALMGIPLVALGGVALLVVSAGLMMLAPALVLLGTMSWDAIGRGLTMLGASLAILAVGGLLLIPASVGFLLLGVAMLLIGAGAFLAGAGMLMFAAGFIALTGAAALGAEAIKMALTTIIEMIPAMMAAFAQGLIDFALVIANGAIEFTAAATTLIQSIITGIANNGPLVINTLWDLLMLMASKLEENVPILVEKGGNLIIGVLEGMTAKIPGIAKAGTDLMIALMKAIANEVPRLADEGAKAIIKLVNGISTAIDNNAAEMGAAGGRLAAAIVRGMVNGIGAGVGEIVNAAKNMAQNALNAAKNLLGIKSPSKEFFYLGEFSSEGYAGGIMDTLSVVKKAGEKVGETALLATQKSLANIKNAVAMDMSMSPTIRPVLDLTGIKKDAGLIGGILTPPGLKLDNSVAYASQAQMAGYEAQEAETALELDRAGMNSGGDVNFYQTNNSPKALSNAEIYRKTNNQLSVAKKELTIIDTQ